MLPIVSQNIPKLCIERVWWDPRKTLADTTTVVFVTAYATGICNEYSDFLLNDMAVKVRYEKRITVSIRPFHKVFFSSGGSWKVQVILKTCKTTT